MPVPVVACVLRKGGDFDTSHVARLYQDVTRWWPEGESFRFEVLTDADTRPLPLGVETRPLQHTWPHWWAKMELFTAAQDDLGDILYFDLDTLIVGPLDDIARVNRLTLLEDFYHFRRVQSGMMFLPVVSRPVACAAWTPDQEYVMKTMRGDGEFLDMVWQDSALRWQETLPDQVVSYKLHVRQFRGQPIPHGARIVCFHGRPRPWNTPLWRR